MSEPLPSRDDGAPSNEADLDAYLDGLLPEGGQADDAYRRNVDAAWRDAAELQDQIDAALIRRFPPAAPPPEQLQQVEALFGRPEVVRSSGQTRRRALLAAAAVLVALGIGSLLRDQATPHRAPFFQPTPLAAIYRAAVAGGFEPYYECREPERLTAIYQRRLNAGLHLLAMPPGSRMLGLSYPGGLSRDTTAMLCRVEGQPVMVLVDRREADRQQRPAGTFQDQRLHLHRTERGGLVFYEVSPFDQPRAMPYLVQTSRATPAM